MQIAICGIGTISAIGNTVAESLETLKSGKSPISKIENIRHLRKPYLGGQIKLSDEALKAELGIEPNTVFPRSALLSAWAAKEAWGNSENHDEIRTAFISATSVGGMELSEQFYFDYQQNESFDLIENLSTHDNGAGTDLILDALGVNASRYTISTACSSAANAILLGARMIEMGIIDRALVGGGDALSNFTLNGFDSLMIYDTEWCKPFDDTRKGLNLGEAAGFLRLENDKAMKLSDSQPLAYVKGWANANDSYHQTASSPDGKGATLAITKAIAKAGIDADQIDYINAHGTATPNNDLSESTAFKNVFGNQIPAFSSTKAFTGHTLAAAGGIEAVFSVLAIRENLIFPNLNYSNAMKETDFAPQTEIKSQEVNHVLSNSFGFGGNSTSLVFSS
ncbi:MAG: beta-ketoacyl-[acyl-carrier-protein] synthase family protein [Flavobacteriales bacterium]|nr:beta-ketoacyl-[acyl-carrier-protein] synthase family protein [Flavobacteriales bacterium]